MARIFAFVTAEMVTTESAEHGDAAARGWVDVDWSATTLHESRNDVRPIVDANENDDDLADMIRDAVSRVVGAYETDGNGTLYAVDAMTLDYATDESWSYAIHFTRKTYDSRGWVEESFDPTPYLQD